MSIYRITNDDDYNEDAMTQAFKIFEKDADGMIILEKGVDMITDGYTIKYTDDKGNKYIVIGRRERNKLYKRQRLNIGLLHVIDYRVNMIMYSVKYLITFIASTIIIICFYYARILLYTPLEL